MSAAEWASWLIAVASLIAGVAAIPPSRRRRLLVAVCGLFAVAAVAFAVVGGVFAPGAAPATATTPLAPSQGRATATAMPSPSRLGTYLTQLPPLQQTPFGYATVPVQMKGVRYAQGIRFVCQNAESSLVYEVAGATYLDVTVGVPDDAKYQASGVSATVTFYQSTSTVALAPPIVADPANPQHVSINLQGASQLKISCSTNTPRTTFSDVALGDPTLRSGPA